MPTPKHGEIIASVGFFELTKTPYICVVGTEAGKVRFAIRTGDGNKMSYIDLEPYAADLFAARTAVGLAGAK